MQAAARDLGLDLRARDSERNAESSVSQAGDALQGSRVKLLTAYRIERALRRQAPQLDRCIHRARRGSTNYASPITLPAVMCCLPYQIRRGLMPSPTPNATTSATSSLASESIHCAFIEDKIPKWLIDATAPRRAALKDANLALPDWYHQVSVQQRDAISAASTASFISQTALDKALSGFKDIDTFAEPLLVSALEKQFRVTLDVKKTFVCLRKPVEMGILSIDVASFEFLKLPLLQAALHNFEAWECETDAFHESSGFVLQGTTPEMFEPLATSLTVAQFTALCRSLDIGAKYQDYLTGYFKPANGVLDPALQVKFIAAQKDALWAAAELALHKKHIELADYNMIKSVIQGEMDPRLNGKSVWLKDLSLMKHRMTGCVLFSIGGLNHHENELILYVPHDPEHPLKRYTYTQMRAEFKRQFTAADPSGSQADGPTSYQRFFSQFVAYADRAHYFSQFTEDSPDAPFVDTVGPYLPLLNNLTKVIGAFSVFTAIKELPPAGTPKQVAVKDPYLAPDAMDRADQRTWAENTDVWAYLFERHCDQLFADAKSHAVPTADVDALARSKKLSGLLNIGMLLLGGVSMFVPVLGEIMMGVMVAQLLQETFEGVVEWSEGDRKAAKAHLIDVAENLALLAVMTGAGKGLAKLTAVKAEPVIEGLERVTLPNGQVRLWKPNLEPYERNVDLTGAQPDAQGHYVIDGTIYARRGGKTYEIFYHASSKQSRIKHPSDPDAHQPVLTPAPELSADRSVTKKAFGYPLSGEGAAGTSGLNPSLAPRVLDLYPDLTIQQANGFVLKQVQAGKTDAQIFSRLQTLSREWDALERTLDQWASAGDEQRATTVRAIKTCWRNAPLAEENPGLRKLSIVLDAPLPVLEADFSHVLELDVQGAGVTPNAINVMLERFPEVQDLSLTNAVLRSAPHQLSRMQKLTRLTLQLEIPLRGVSSRLRTLANLEELNLSIRGPLEDEGNLDLSNMDKLRVLTIDAPHLKTWPSGLFELPHLERLDLKSTAIKTLPTELSKAHEQLLQGLNLNWSDFTEGGLTSAYESLKNTSGGALLREAIGGEYCQRVLPRFGPWDRGDLRLLYEMLGSKSWKAIEEIDSLSRQYDELCGQLDAWSAGKIEERAARQQMGQGLQNCWRKTVLKHFGVHGGDMLVAMSDGLVSELPVLSGQKLSSVRILKLNDLRLPAERIREFIRAFPATTNLDLSRCELAEVPLVSDDLPALEILNLDKNPLTRVDVRGMNNLWALMLRATELSEWPSGVEDLPNLMCLDLRESRLSTLPEVFLSRDELVLNTHLGGTPLNPQALSDLQVARQRVEGANVLPQGALERLATAEVSPTFPPLRAGLRLSKTLWTLPPPEILEGEGALSLEGRLRRTLPGLTEAGLSGWLEAMNEKGFTSSQIHQLINVWNQQFETLTRELNGWMLDRYSQVRQNVDVRKAGFHIIYRWAQGRFAPSFEQELNLSGLKLGVLPELSLPLTGVTKLDMTGMELSSTACEAFLRSVTDVRTLRLSKNPLEVLPSTLSSLEQLERLELSDTGLEDSDSVNAVMRRFKHLKWLDLSRNRLGFGFDLTGLDALETVDLSYNYIYDWPEGVFESRTLKTLNLASNQLDRLPDELFEEQHEALVKGINVVDNALEIGFLRRIRDELRVASGDVPPHEELGSYLGYTLEQVTQEVIDYEDEVGASGEEGNSDEISD